jgi:hypothetical protein
MDRARQKLKRAKMALNKDRYDDARRLAEEAQADAELAKAIATKNQTDRMVMEVENNIKALREEVKRTRRNTN